MRKRGLWIISIILLMTCFGYLYFADKQAETVSLEPMEVVYLPPAYLDSLKKDTSYVRRDFFAIKNSNVNDTVKFLNEIDKYILEFTDSLEVGRKYKYYNMSFYKYSEHINEKTRHDPENPIWYTVDDVHANLLHFYFVDGTLNRTSWYTTGEATSAIKIKRILKLK